MSHEAQDQDDSGTPVSLSDLARYGVTAGRLREAEQAAARGWSLMDSIDKETRDRAEAAARISGLPAAQAVSTIAQHYAALAHHDKSLTESLLQNVDFRASAGKTLAAQLANFPDATALARAAMTSASIESLAGTSRLWERLGVNSAVLDAVRGLSVNEKTRNALQQIGEDVSRLSGTRHTDLISKASAMALGKIASPAVTSLAGTLSQWHQENMQADADLAAKMMAAASPETRSTIDKLIEQSSLYAKSLYEQTGTLGAIDRVTMEARARGFSPSLEGDDYKSVRSTMRRSPVPQDATTDESEDLLDVEEVEAEEIDQEAALQAVLEAIEVEFDPDSPPTPEEVTALKAFAGLMVILRPSLRDDPEVGRWLVGMTTGTTLQVLVYLAIAHPGILATLFIVTGITSSTKWVHSKATGLFLPGSDEATEEDDTKD